ncbi:TetR family transcriptional regulator [Burkholderiaceae bacterium DAT-1]|nr:TetR family transcriptional regulator [Burkholderiaceae bacterium DAT-1]
MARKNAIRALAQEDKDARRIVILDAARTCFQQDMRQLPSVATIADASSLAKGTVYLYFKTKESIFAALLAAEFAALFGLIRDILVIPGTREAIVGRFLTGMLAYLDEHPEFLHLDAMSYSVLERNLDETTLRQFKLDLVRGLEACGRQLELALQFEQGRGVPLLTRTYALARGIWQSLDYPPGLGRIIAEPDFASIRPDFRSELVAALNEYWTGVLVLSDEHHV